ncbi:insulinase family protein [Demequina subtropica]|uniref:insulinase family protein n=1 Tax=Demequina subtropica TaxID=1638989 RepID=UPI0007843CC3|nr:insulinase family protein [Demequina subtropica]
MAIPTLQTTDHRGIPVLWSDIRSTFTGTLAFAVGRRDELARTAGVTHLVEHLVMSRVGRVSVTHNASTEEDRVTFYAEGAEAAVADFLGRVAAAIRDLDAIDDAVVAEQRRIIAAELGEGDETTGAGPLLDRFGASTLGLLDLGMPAHRSLSREQALEWAATWLHAGNAVLTFTGPVPDGLGVDLPAARPLPERAAIAPLGHRRHGWLGGGAAPLALSFALDASERGAVYVAGAAIQRTLLDQLRTERHLVYSVDAFVARTDATTRWAVVALDPRREDILATAVAAVEILRTLAAEGPSDELMAAILEEDENITAHSGAQIAHLDDAAMNLLRHGVEPAAIDAVDMAAVPLDRVREAIAGAVETLLVSLGEIDDEITPEQLSERLGLPWAREPEGHYESMSTAARVKAFMPDSVEMLSPRWFSGMRGAQLIFDPERILMLAPELGIVELRWDAIALAGVCVDCGHWDLTGENGAGFVIEPGRWRGGAKAVDALRERVPAGAVYEVRDLQPGGAPAS